MKKEMKYMSTYEAPKMNEYEEEGWLQVRTMCGDQIMHLQGRGKETVNRDYGMANQFRVPSVITEWLSEQETKWFSLASPQQLYIPAYLFRFEDGYQLVIKGSENFNMPKPLVKAFSDEKMLIIAEGAIINLQPKSMLCNALIDFCEQNDLIVEGQGSMLVVDANVGEEE